MSTNMNDTVALNPEIEQEVLTPNTKQEDTTTAVGADSSFKMSQEEIVAKLAEIVEFNPDAPRSEIEALKSTFYKNKTAEIERLKKEAQEDGVEQEKPEETDQYEVRLKEILNKYKEKRSALLAEDEKQKAENLEEKLKLIEQLKGLSERTEDYNVLYNEFKDIQAKWKLITDVPQEHAKTLWTDYQLYSEAFYDIIKINNEFRDYDFKKNLAQKTLLCETLEKISEDKDLVSAFYQLQKLHQQWRDIGPVAKEYRTEIWARFKAASVTINKKYQVYFEEKKANEKENLDQKIQICERIESINASEITSAQAWREIGQEVTDLQAKWKTIGYVKRSVNNKIFERYRTACDVFYDNKKNHYKGVRESLDENLKRKRLLCEQAEALKDSTDWKVTTSKLVELQREWKTIGHVNKKHTETLWKRFVTACDYFFEQKKLVGGSQRDVEQNNLAAKKELVKKLENFDESLTAAQAEELLKDLASQWNSIGHVPYKEKEKMYDSYKTALNKQYSRLKIDRNSRKMQDFQSSISDLSSNDKGKDKLYYEREKLVRIHDRMRSELLTYENNMGFFNVSSKGGGGLVKEMQNKIDSLKAEIEFTKNKIKTIDKAL